MFGAWCDWGLGCKGSKYFEWLVLLRRVAWSMLQPLRICVVRHEERNGETYSD